MSDFWKQNKRMICLLLLIVLVNVGIIYATTFKYLYTSSEITLAQTTGYGGSDAQASTTVYTFTGDIDLETNGYYGMWLTVQHSATGVTDDLVISYFASYDGTNFDSVGNEFWTVQTNASLGPGSQTTFQMFPAPPHGRVGLRTTGTTDTFDYRVVYIPAQGDGT